MQCCTIIYLTNILNLIIVNLQCFGFKRVKIYGIKGAIIFTTKVLCTEL